jgi:hypothetical protein
LFPTPAPIIASDEESKRRYLPSFRIAPFSIPNATTHPLHSAHPYQLISPHLCSHLHPCSYSRLR